MFSLSELRLKLERMINYVNNIRYYWDRAEKGKMKANEREEILKYFEITIEELYFILKDLLRLNGPSVELESLKDILNNLKNGYIISDRCIEKIIYIDDFHNKLLVNNKKNNKDSLEHLEKITEYFDDILDEIYEYLSL